MANWNDLFGGGGLPQLAPDLTYPSDKASSLGTSKAINGISAVGALTTALSLTGKFIIHQLAFTALTAESITIKLTVDSVVIWNDTFVCGTTESLINDITGAIVQESYSCESAFLLEIQTTADASVNLTYLAREIL